jgi:hypothetical protein
LAKIGAVLALSTDDQSCIWLRQSRLSAAETEAFPPAVKSSFLFP